jgi:hypothetical protein
MATTASIGRQPVRWPDPRKHLRLAGLPHTRKAVLSSASVDAGVALSERAFGRLDGDARSAIGKTSLAAFVRAGTLVRVTASLVRRALAQEPGWVPQLWRGAYGVVVKCIMMRRRRT